MKIWTWFRPFATLALLHVFSPTSAGPPLSIDDPGILDLWQMEIITATTLTSTDAGDNFQLPVLDFSMGVIEDYVQVGAAYSYVQVDPSNGSSESGFGNLTVGAKWRFLNSDKLQMAFAPAYVFGISRRAAANGIGDDTDTVVLPVNAEYQINEKWRLNGEVLYASVNNGDSGWRYGAATAFALNKRWELLFELSAAGDNSLSADFVDARVGFDTALNDSLHLLFSMATGLHEPSGEDKLDYDIYLGLLFFR